MIAAFLILLLAFAATVQVAAVLRCRGPSGVRSLPWRIFAISAGISVVVASFDTYVIASEVVRHWQFERKAAAWRTEDATSCAQGDGGACLKVARLWMWGTGGPVDVTKAFSLAKKGCAIGNKHACDLVDEIETDGGPERYFYRRRLRWPPMEGVDEGSRSK